MINLVHDLDYPAYMPWGKYIESAFNTAVSKLDNDALLVYGGHDPDYLDDSEAYTDVGWVYYSDTPTSGLLILPEVVDVGHVDTLNAYRCQSDTRPNESEARFFTAALKQIQQNALENNWSKERFDAAVAALPKPTASTVKRAFDGGFFLNDITAKIKQRFPNTNTIVVRIIGHQYKDASGRSMSITIADFENILHDAVIDALGCLHVRGDISTARNDSVHFIWV